MAKLERIKEIEAEIQRTQKNKATEYHLGRLKAQLAKLRGALIEESQKASGGPKDGFDVARTGDARVALVGLPSVGKSSLVQSLTAANTQVAEYAFTTLTCVPGLLYYKDAKIQILDLPGIIEGASENKGRGKQVISTIKSADIILMILDPTTSNLHDNRRLLEKELNTLNIRLNKRRPDAQVSVKKSGGIKISTTVPLTKDLLKEVQSALVWGTSVKFNPQIVGLEHELEDDDVVEFVRKSTAQK
ncbi:uncharacterized protein LOC133320732 [Danaus plexippus]|uniref:uncharacterized protein LOC133320732 n=1 Tax=Danaus plexippus TaxID=13037 RepID=UPI002AB2F68D|nr:uncharacterized protein LOC133320732 [Danaus plexippus]